MKKPPDQVLGGGLRVSLRENPTLPARAIATSRTNRTYCCADGAEAGTCWGEGTEVGTITVRQTAT